MNIIKSSVLTLAAGMAFGGFAAESNLIEVGSVNPVPGSVITQFNYTTIVLNEPMEIASLEQVGEVSYQVRQFGHLGGVTAGFPIEAVLTRSGDIRVRFTEEAENEIYDMDLWPVSNPGIYVLNITEGALKVTDKAGKVWTNSAIRYEYSLLPSVKYTSTPANDAKVSMVSENILVQFDEFESMYLTDNYSATLTSAEGANVALGTPQITQNVLAVPLADGALSTPGEYTFTLGVGSIDLEGNDMVAEQINPTISFKFNVVGVSKPVINELSPAPGVVESLSGVAMVYNMPPYKNKECTETLKVYRDEVLILEYDNNSPRLQFAIDNEDPNMVTYTFTGSLDGIYRDPGTYHVEIPEGFLIFRSGDMVYPSEALSLEYIIPKRFAYTVDPMPGTVTEISEITVTFPEAVSIVQNELVADEDGNGVIVFTSKDYVEGYMPEITITGNKVHFQLAETYTKPDNYWLILPNGAFTMTDADGYVMENQNIDLIYYINKFPAPTADPAPGEYESLGEITFTLEGGMTYSLWFPQAMYGGILYQVAADGTLGTSVGQWVRVKNAEGGYDSVAGTSSVTLAPVADYELAPGQYALVFRKSCFSVNVPEGSEYEGGFNNTEIRYYYTILPDQSAEMTPQYESGHEFIGKIESFEVYFDKADSVVIEEKNAQVTVTTAEGNDVANTVNVSLLSGRAGLTILFDPAIEINGEYIVTIPAGALRINGKLTPEYQLTYSLSGGISGVALNGADEASATVYGIDGTVVLRNADMDAVRALPAGLYIVNGKKYVVR